WGRTIRTSPMKDCKVTTRRSATAATASAEARAAAVPPSADTESAHESGRRGQRARRDADQYRVAVDALRDAAARGELGRGRRLGREVVVLDGSLLRAHHAGVAARLQETDRRRRGGEEHSGAGDPGRLEDQARAHRRD